jgi:hypothetical protein
MDRVRVGVILGGKYSLEYLIRFLISEIEIEISIDSLRIDIDWGVQLI